MKRFTKLIPLLALILSVGACNTKQQSISPTQSESAITEPSQSEEPSVSSETQEEKALREAKERAQALLASANEDNYIEPELTQLRSLKAALTSAIASAQAPGDMDAAYNALDQFLKTAKTKAEYEAEAAAALQEAKEAASQFLQTVNPDLYEGDELAAINQYISELNGLIANATTAEQITTKIEEIRSYLETAKTKAEHEAERLQEAKNAAEAYMQTVDPSLYEGDELDAIVDLLNDLSDLLNEATTAEQITAKVQELQTYLATAKTKAEYEAERAAALAARKEERLQEIVLERPNQYRSEEKAMIEQAQEEFTAAINAAETIEEVNAVDIGDFNYAISQRTNVQYMLDEMFYYREPSAWPLVNEHAENYTHQQGGNGIGASFTGGDGIGYIMSPVKYQGDFELSMQLNNADIITNTVGLVIGNYHDTASGDGLDGYFINYDVAADHQYVQIYYMNNAYQSYGTPVLEYIGGWIYNNDYPGTTLGQRSIRVKYDGYNLHIMDDQDYLEYGEENTVKITVPLAFNGSYAIDPGDKTFSFGFLNWSDANQVRGIFVKELTTATPVVSRLMARQIAISEESRLDLSLYEQDEQDQFTAKMAEIEALYDNGTYAQIMVKVDEYIELKKTLKTHEQWENERHPDISVQLLDNIYSGDPTKYTPSNWALVDEHAFGSWTHEQGSHTIVTNGDAGYCMDAADHTNFTVVFKVTGTQAINPYNAAWPDSAIIIGGATNGDYFTGYEIVLSQDPDWGFQLYDSMTGAVGDPGCYADQFKGGFAKNSEGVTYRLTVMNGILKVYVVDPTTGAETQVTSGVDGTFTNVTEWNVGSLHGHFGIMDWGGATTYEILEFKDF